ncbi:uncharacterized protein LOC123526932 [Mercenaria mercenaria]|uniref:uncharacterized protein LOC123526932 n=1 Tax=Mercenaria mercenaria TaxID=6596 RepID=UPI00234F61C0|nr:uncharacterized protein LOC123526932 [Mercenaria mercenaria]
MSFDVHVRGCHSFYIEYGISRDTLIRHNIERFVVDTTRAIEEPHTILFYEPFLARFLRVYPYEHDYAKPVCVKLELLGCRTEGSLSLRCYSRQHREVLETTELFIPLSEKNATGFNMPYKECHDWCFYIMTSCIGLELSNGTCRIFLADERQSYRSFRTDFTAATVPCWQDLSMSTSTYFDIFEDQLYNVNTFQVIVYDFEVLTSVGYPFSYKDDQVYRWNIISATDWFTLQFTDISLKINNQLDDSHIVQNDELCSDIIIVSTELIPRDHRHTKTEEFQIFYIFDNKYNGHYPSVPVPFPNIFLEFRACTRKENDDESYRGFSVYMFHDKDALAPCPEKMLCGLPSMELSSGSFLGHLQEIDMVYTWSILQFVERSFILLDFDVSCTSGAQFIWQEDTRIAKSYCNGNRTFGEFQTYTLLPSLHFYTAVSFCGQLLFREGFRLSYTIPEKRDKILNLTTSQSDMVDHRPLWLIKIVFPEFRVDVTANMLNEGKFREVCAPTFEKCYTIYVGIPQMLWDDLFRFCADRNATLVTFKTKLEMEYVRQAVLKWLVDIDIIGIRRDYYSLPLVIGLTRYVIDNERHRDYWVDGRLLEFTAWYCHETLTFHTFMSYL